MGVDAATVAQVRMHPDEAQRVFRVLVDALASPGRTYRLPPAVIRRAPMALAPLLAVADVDVTVAVHPDRDGWTTALAAATGASVTDLDEAEWVAFLEPPGPRLLDQLDPGSVYAPERGTRISVAVPALVTVDERHRAPDGATVVRLSGPGVPGHVDLAVGGIDGAVFTALAAINSAFPAGLDTWLLTDVGHVAAIPRSSSIDVR